MPLKQTSLQQGDWLLAKGLYAQFMAVKDGLLNIRFYNQANDTLVDAKEARAIYINPQILLSCGFTQYGKFYRDDVFEITFGGKDELFIMSGHRLKKPYAAHLLSQLHLLQHIYYKETGKTLIFRPPV